MMLSLWLNNLCFLVRTSKPLRGNGIFTKKTKIAQGQDFVDSSQHWAPLCPVGRWGICAEKAHMNSFRKLLMSKDDELACLTPKPGPRLEAENLELEGNVKLTH